MYKLSRNLFIEKDYENFDPNDYTIPVEKMLAEADELLKQRVRLQHLSLPIRHVVHRAWSIHFAVDEIRHLVYLTKSNCWIDAQART
jgi:hypothetical protein